MAAKIVNSRRQIERIGICFFNKGRDLLAGGDWNCENGSERTCWNENESMKGKGEKKNIIVTQCFLKGAH